MHLFNYRLTALLLCAVGAQAAPQDAPAEDSGTVFISAEKVIVRPGKVIEDCGILIVDGKIHAVGQRLAAPGGATMISGKVVCAGFLDPWSTLGLEAASVNDTRCNPSTLTTDALDPFASDYAREQAREAGVLAVRVQVGVLATLGGYGAWCSTGPGFDREGLVLLGDANQAGMVGLSTRGTLDVFDRLSGADKIGDEIRSGLDYHYDQVKFEKDLAEWEAAIAESEKELEKDFKKAKKDRDKDIEEAEEDGKEYKEKRYKEDRKPKAPKYDAEKAAMARVANGEVPLVVECHRTSELRALLASTAPFDRLRLIIAGGTEAMSVADQLAARKIPVIVRPAPLTGTLPDHLAGHDLSLAAQLAEAGVPVLLGSGNSSSSDLPLLAAGAIGYGLDPEEAFAALTLRAARALDLADQVGTVQKGRRGDLLVLSGDPFALSTSITHVLVDGEVVSEKGQ